MRTCLENEIPKEKLNYESSKAATEQVSGYVLTTAYSLEDSPRQEKWRLLCTWLGSCRPQTRKKTVTQSQNCSRLPNPSGNPALPKHATNSETRDPRKAEAQHSLDTPKITAFLLLEITF